MVSGRGGVSYERGTLVAALPPCHCYGEWWGERESARARERESEGARERERERERECVCGRELMRKTGSEPRLLGRSAVSATGISDAEIWLGAPWVPRAILCTENVTPVQIFPTHKYPEQK